ncbi:protein IRREGULAR XYLEM 15-like [Phalaenopsis equestris]|uniref:protein IRREGULAR XYLEM 15-like n=1 Tax=Phalaenopsis equestris TaxID=78828 RepID=UPI0009E2817F|nr:protein IRREGULAR XYLEM 15-like [Phalaenopsis equestris]
MKSFAGTRFILLQPSLPKHNTAAAASAASAITPPSSAHHRLLLVALISLFALASILTLLSSTSGESPSLLRATASLSPITTPVPATPLHPILFDSLLHYATQSASNGRMSDLDLRSIAAVLRRRGPCNLLVFGLGPESLLWRSLNHGGRTVFVDENQYYISHYEERHPGLEGYDVAYTTKVSELGELIAAVRKQIGGECRPIQNLLFSDCRLAINDLPNHLYDVGWDVILVDGPRGYSPASPGRMSAIFTAAVLARSGGAGPTDVLVHDYEREVERVCSAEFLCGENLLGVAGQLAHFVVRGGGAARKDDFCFNRTATAVAML